MDYYEINRHYRRNPPQIVIDDLGIDDEIYVPFPAKYKKLPCECGKIHKWEENNTFEIVEISLTAGHLKKVKQCIECKTILSLELHQKMYDD